MDAVTRRIFGAICVRLARLHRPEDVARCTCFGAGMPDRPVCHREARCTAARGNGPACSTARQSRRTLACAEVVQVAGTTATTRHVRHRPRCLRLLAASELKGPRPGAGWRSHHAGRARFAPRECRRARRVPRRFAGPAQVRDIRCEPSSPRITLTKEGEARDIALSAAPPSLEPEISC